MTTTLSDFEQLACEHQALLAQYGRVQLRCSEAIAAQARQVERLEGEVMRLRAAAIQRDTALDAARERQAGLEAATPGMPRRQALARKVESLVNRIQELTRERLRMQCRMEHAAPVLHVAAVAEGALRARAVLCVGADASGATATQHAVERAGGQFMHHDGRDQEGSAALEASLVAADLVICQTGCVSHNAYWRVQDHCRRTGKQCVLVAQPQAMLFVRSAVAGVPARETEVEGEGAEAAQAVALPGRGKHPL